MKFKTFLNEMAYPASFSFDEMMKIPAYRNKIRYASTHLKRISSGSSRVVYQVDEEKVLKIAKNDKGLHQNGAESDWGLQKYSLMAKIFEVSEEYKDIGPFWLEMELAKKLSASRFAQLADMTFKELGDLLRLRFLYKKPSSTYSERYKHLVNENEFYGELEKIIADYDFPYGDFTKLNSFGEVMRDGKPAIVIIDSGLTQDIAKNVYGWNA